MSTELTSSPTVAPGHDRIQAVPADRPGWAENLVFQVHDAASGLAVWCHWGRMPEAPEIWEGLFALYLDGGELLVSRAFARSPSPDTASGGALSFRCVEPGRLWAMRFDGMARSTSTAELARGPLVDGAVEPVSVELTFTGLHPLWSAHGAMDGQTWAQAHLEQAGRISGRVDVRGRCVEIDAFGFRDHSYGPRDYSGLLGDTWCTAVFPSGRAFLTLDVWQIEGPSLRKGFIWDGTTVTEAVAIDPVRLSGGDGSPHAFDLQIDAGQRVERVHVVQRHCMMATMGQPSALIPGASVGDPRIYATEGPATITWDGEVAAGWIEKTIRFG